MKFVISGCGPAGINAALYLDKLLPEPEITLINGEPNPPYSRILTTFYLENKIEEKDLYIYDNDFFKQENVNYYEDVKVVSINKKRKTVKISNGKIIEYDKLLIATGGDPKRPSVTRIDSDKIYTVRTLVDIKKINEKINIGGKCVIMGGGLVSLKMAQALRRRGLDVTILISSQQVLSQVLDQESATIIADQLIKNGIEIKTGIKIIEIKEEKEKLKLKLEFGHIEADFAVIGKGVSPNVNFIDGTKISVDWGILTDDNLSTEETDIYAAGDVIESYNIAYQCRQLNSIWPDAVLQGITAASNMAGKAIAYSGNINMNAVDIFALPLIALGQVEELPELKIFKYENKLKQEYKKLFFAADKLVGAVLIGDIKNAGFLKQLIVNQKLVTNKEELLAPNNVLANYIF